MGRPSLRSHLRRGLIGAAPASVGLAAAILAMSALVLASGSVIPVSGIVGRILGALHTHPGGGLVAMLFGMGAPVHWAVLPIGLTGTTSALDVVAATPILLFTTLVVAAGVTVMGIGVARTDSDLPAWRVRIGAMAWFVGLTMGAAVLVSHLRPISVGGAVRAELNISPITVLLLSAAWGALGLVAGNLAQRRWDARIARAAGRLPHRGIARSAVAMSLALVVLAGCSNGGARTASAAPRHAGPTNAETTTSTSPSTTTSSAPVVDPATTTTAGSSSSGVRAAGRRTGSSSSAGAGAGSGSAGAGGNGATSPAAAAAVAAASGLRPPAPGNYAYDTTGSLSYFGGTKTYPSLTNLIVDPAAGAIQHVLRNLTDGADGFVIEQTLDYRPEGIFVNQQRLSVSLGGMKTVRTMQPTTTAMWLANDARPGAHHEFDLQGKNITGHETIDVLRAEKATVGGQILDTLVMRTVLTFAGSASGTVTLDQWFARSVRLPVKEHLVGDVRASFVRITTQYDAVLRSLTP